VTIDGELGKIFYVLTYIPDLAWCRVGRMQQDGVFGAEREKKVPGVLGRCLSLVARTNASRCVEQVLTPCTRGRPRWKLEPEGNGSELDVSALRCRVQPSRAVRRVQDADLEEWDMLELPDDGAPAAGPDAAASAPTSEGSSTRCRHNPYLPPRFTVRGAGWGANTGVSTSAAGGAAQQPHDGGQESVPAAPEAAPSDGAADPD
jgi:hypothetical protein